MFRSLANIIKLSSMMTWTIICLVIALLMILFTFSGKSAVWFARVLYAPTMLRLAGARMDVKGTEKIDYSSPKVYMCNHQSLLDIPILMLIIRSGSYFVAKHELGKIPVFGWYMKALGMIFVKRGAGPDAIRSLHKAGELIRSGRSVIIFPEGTRSRTGEIASFKKGGFHVAMAANVDIVPISIMGANVVLPYELMNRSSCEVKVRIGEAISVKEYERRTVGKLLKLTEQRIKDLSSV